MSEYIVRLPKPHQKQEEFIHCGKKRIVCRAGRRSGKTVGVSLLAVEQFLKGQRILYGAPTSEQVNRFWVTVTRALDGPIRAGIFKKNETDRVIERVGTEQRIRAKTCWNANTLRGDYCSLLILDEWQLMAEETWEVVGAPMLLDCDGDAVFIYTPPSLHSTAMSKAEDPRHAAKLFKAAKEDTTGRWAAFHFTSHDNPHISGVALIDIIKDMTQLAYEQEILAEDKDEAPGALWHHEQIDKLRATTLPTLVRVVVGVDPPGSTGTECGIVVAGKGVDGHGYILADRSLLGTPNEWATAVVKAYKDFKADRVVAETNYGGDMVESTLRNVEGGQSISYKSVVATRGKAIRAEPIAALYERSMIHPVGVFPRLEDEQCNWAPGDPRSPNRLDALVWAATELDIAMDTKVNYESLGRRPAAYAGRGAY